MLETLSFIVSGYAGYVGWPWWIATALGAVAGAYNAARRFYVGPWRDRLLADGSDGKQAFKALIFVVLWTGSISAVLMTGIWGAARLITSYMSG